MSKKKKGAIAGVAAAVVIVWCSGAGNATYTINEQEQAVVTTFVSAMRYCPGLHFKIPFVQHVTKVNTTIQSLRIGYDNNNDVVADESIMITSDFNFR